VNRDEKISNVAMIGEKLKESQSAMLVDFKKLNVESANKLRRELRAVSAELKVAKNTLTNIAIDSIGDSADLSCLKEYLSGPTGLIFSYGDPAASAKVVSDFIKENPNLQIKVGHLSGKLLGQDEYERLAKLPSREVLLAQLAGTFNANMRSMATLLSAIQRKFLYTLQAFGEKKKETMAPDALPPQEGN